MARTILICCAAWGGVGFAVGCGGSLAQREAESFDARPADAPHGEPSIESLAFDHAEPPALSDEATEEDGFGASSDSPSAASASAASTAPDRPPAAVLSEREAVEEHFPDGTLRGRWHVRLYVTFNRALPWQRQTPGSYEFHGPYEEYYPGGRQLFSQGEYADGVRHGDWTYWHPNGGVAKTGRYANGKLEGQWKVFREDGTLLRTENYLGHEKHGVWESYADDGRSPLAREQYDHGRRHGTWTRWHAQGTKAEEAKFDRGKLHGPRRTWHPNGQLASEEPYREGKPQGTLRRWDEKGAQIGASR